MESSWSSHRFREVENGVRVSTKSRKKVSKPMATYSTRRVDLTTILTTGPDAERRPSSKDPLGASAKMHGRCVDRLRVKVDLDSDSDSDEGDNETKRRWRDQPPHEIDLWKREYPVDMIRHPPGQQNMNISIQNFVSLI